MSGARKFIDIGGNGADARPVSTAPLDRTEILRGQGFRPANLLLLQPVGAGGVAIPGRQPGVQMAVGVCPGWAKVEPGWVHLAQQAEDGSWKEISIPTDTGRIHEIQWATKGPECGN